MKLSLEMFSVQVYRCTTRGHFPVRWTPPETTVLFVSSACDTSMVDARSSAQSAEYLYSELL